jgi:hypothetical protein
MRRRRVFETLTRRPSIAAGLDRPLHWSITLADDEDDKMTIVPIPGEDDEERQRIRDSNDRDQEMERRGEQSRHNRGYDEAADGIVRTPEIERVVDE